MSINLCYRFATMDAELLCKRLELDYQPAVPTAPCPDVGDVIRFSGRQNEGWFKIIHREFEYSSAGDLTVAFALDRYR